MFDYRLFFPQHSLQDGLRDRRPVTGHVSRRIHALNEKHHTRRTDGRR